MSGAYFSDTMRRALIKLTDPPYISGSATELGLSGMTLKALHRLKLLNAESDGMTVTYWANNNGLARRDSMR